MQPLAFLGGTFDPVHFGHLRVAVEMAESLALPQVVLLPCFQPPHRDSPVAPAAERRAMLELAVDGYPQLAVDPRELLRGGYSYTVETLQEVRDELGDSVPVYFAMGLDAFNGLPGWHNWQALFDLANIVVMTRPGYQPEPSHPALAGRQTQFDGRHRPSGGLYHLAVTPLNISATGIRDKLAVGRSISFLLPQAVEHYIQQHRLYLA